MASLLDKLKEGASKYGQGAIDNLNGPNGPIQGVKDVLGVPIKGVKKVASDVLEGGQAIGKNIGEMVDNTIKRGNPLKQAPKSGDEGDK
jgi:hypothetical protein